MNVKSSKVIINRFLFNKFGGGGGTHIRWGLIIGCIILYASERAYSRRL